MTDNSALSERFACAQEVMAQAADLSGKYFSALETLTVDEKAPQSLVSEADREVERLIRSTLLRAFPTDGFVGEESGTVDTDTARGVWVVDPIDGTQPFLLGLPTWCVSIAYVYDRRVELGLITKPADNDVFVAQRGQGATLNGAPLSVSQAVSMAEGITGIGCAPRDHHVVGRIVDGILSRNGVFRQTGSGACDLTYVATGQYLGVVNQSLRSWDCLAALCIIEEAGGRVTDFIRQNGIASYGPLVASAPGVFAEMCALLGEAFNGEWSPDR
jgi:myo-inositol-1(or 4)-monophosphatase